MMEFIYSWQGYDQFSQLHKGDIVSQSTLAARQQLMLQGIIPIKVKRRCRFSLKYRWLEQQIMITQQLGVMLQAGFPLVSILRLLAQQHTSMSWRYMLTNIADELTKGTPFSEALEKFPQLFRQDYRQIIATGELTGELATCCTQLAEQQQSLLALKKRIIKALRYPLFVFFVMFIVVLLMVTYVLPEFSEIYHSMSVELPWFTQKLIDYSAIVRCYGGYIFIISFIMLYLAQYSYKKSSRWRYYQHYWSLRIPFYGVLITTGCLARLFRILALTQQAGITLAEGLRVASRVIDQQIYQSHIERHMICLMQGMPFYLTISQDNLFPPMVSQFIRIGEESGTLELMLMRLSNLFEQQTQVLADQLTQTLQPISMIILGIIVGGLVVAIYLPLFQLGQVIQ